MVDNQLIKFNSFYLCSEPLRATGSFLPSKVISVAPIVLCNKKLYLASCRSAIELSEHPLLSLMHKNPYSVLVKIIGLSTNFRERGSLELLLRDPSKTKYFIGSDFVGEVICKGRLVRNLKLHDKVIASNSYPPGGLVSTTASAGIQLLDSRRLVSIPSGMPDSIAASFSVPYQTAYSLVRRSGALNSCSHALLTAPRSATSNAIMSILLAMRVPFTILIREPSSIPYLQSIGVHNIVMANPCGSSFDIDLRSSLSGLDISHVFDNFPDVYAYNLIRYLSDSCTYMFAGLLDQGTLFQEPAPRRHDFSSILRYLIMNNIHFIGNCLGTEEDLSLSLKLYGQSKIKVMLDSCFEFGECLEFLNRSFNSKKRFGKTVLLLNSIESASNNRNSTAIERN